MLRRRLDEVAEWTPASSGPPKALRGLWRDHRLGLGRFLLPRLTADFAAPGDVIRTVEADLPGRHVLGLANLSRRRALLPNPRRYCALVLLIFAVPSAVGFAFGYPWIAAILLLSGLLFSAWAYAETVIQLRAYVIDGSAASLALWRTIRANVLDVPDPPPPPERTTQEWRKRLAAAYRGTLDRTEAFAVASLAVPDGRLLLCDPFRIAEAAPIDVPPGTWPVRLAVAFSEYDYGDGRSFDERVSHAWVSFGAAAPARWRQARSGRRPIEVDVDGSIACFASAEAAARIAEDFRGPDCDYRERLSDEIVGRMRVRDRDSWSWAALGEVERAELVAFSSGAGDGGYPVYLGLAADGSLAAVAVDFELVPELIEEPWRGSFEIVWS